MSEIKKVYARQILDSRGNPTIEVDIHTQNQMGRAAIPSGASTGSREAIELRDKDMSKFLGKSVYQAVNNINSIIAPKIIGMSVFEQEKIDQIMIDLDGTENKSNLGANALLGVSLALAQAGAKEKNKPLYRYLKEDLNCPTDQSEYYLPAPLMNIINGGEHASNSLDIQEFMIVPNLGKSFGENLRAGVEIFHNLKKVLTEKGYSTNVGDEGGFAPDLKTNEEALDTILEAIKLAGYKAGEEIFLSLDCAASEFYDEDKKHYKMNGKELTTDELIEYYKNLITQYPIYSIEDGLAEKDFSGWVELNKKIGENVLSIGDDLFVTNEKILAVGIKEKQANSILVKVNQIGTLSETFQTLKLAFENNMKAVISHRSGETADSFIADLAVATSAGHIKTGSSSRTDRVEKYNQLLRIEEDLANQAKYFRIK